MGEEYELGDTVWVTEGLLKGIELHKCFMNLKTMKFSKIKN